MILSYLKFYKTIWNFTEKLKDLGLVRELFDLFEKELRKLKLMVNEGKIVYASFVSSPGQRNSREENKQIKETGTAPKQCDNHPHKKRQKDIDARWTKKNFNAEKGKKNKYKNRKPKCFEYSLSFRVELQ